MKGQYSDACTKYLECIAWAKKEGFVHEHALACERIGLAFYVDDHGESSSSSSPLSLPATRKKQVSSPSGKEYLLKACKCYEEWGAHAKVKQMKDTFPFLAKTRE
mmetsp:Transcript_11044/g.15556  ORF Transcript_11044/g.15556 Transcript_11044/m.15556 type:complete len:105 (+) Transcript_11044:634-948(+)